MKIRYDIKFNVYRLNLESKLRLSLTFQNNRIQTLLKATAGINDNNFDLINQKVKKNYKNSLEINKYLDSIRSNISEFFERKATLNEKYTYDEVKAVVKNITSGNYVNDKIELNDALNQFIDDSKNGLRLTNDNLPIRYGTYKTYLTMKNHLLSFAKTKLKYSLLESPNFIESFISYMTEFDLNNNYQNSIFKNIKVLCKWIEKKEYHKFNIDYSKFSVQNNESSMVALTSDELTKLENKEFSAATLRNTKKCFLIQLYTCLRYSDLKNLKAENIDFENDIIRLTTIKTTESIVIPIGNKLKPLLKEFINGKIKVYSNQTYNDYLEDVFKLAEINEKIEVITFIGKQRKCEVKPKYELITSHTARRSHITLGLQTNKLIPEEIMKISGHKNRNSFQKYVKVAQKQVVEKYKELDLF